MPIIDLNIVDDQSYELIFSPTHQPSSSSSSSSLSSCPILFNSSQQDPAGSSFWESKNLQNDHDEAGKNIIASSGSWNDDPEDQKGGGVEIGKRGLKLKVWKRSSEKEEEDENHHHQTEDKDSSVKWMPSKMRMMRKMMASDNHNKASSSSYSCSDINNMPPVLLADTSQQINSEDQNQNQNQKQQRPLLLSPPGNDINSSSSNNSSINSNSNNINNSNITVRVCADCHTTKTPLWRSGPRGPKSLCNACGIRQRKARRAMAVAAAANGSPNLLQAAAEKSAVKGTYKVRSGSKEKKLKFECETHNHQMKKKHKLIEDDHHHQAKEANNNNNNSRGRSSSSPSSTSSIINKFSFEDFTVSLMSKNLTAASQVFPQDEKEAAILLMALSCNGLVHG